MEKRLTILRGEWKYVFLLLCGAALCGVTYFLAKLVAFFWLRWG